MNKEGPNNQEYQEINKKNQIMEILSDKNGCKFCGNQCKEDACKLEIYLLFDIFFKYFEENQDEKIKIEDFQEDIKDYLKEKENITNPNQELFYLTVQFFVELEFIKWNNLEEGWSLSLNKNANMSEIFTKCFQNLYICSNCKKSRIKAFSCSICKKVKYCDSICQKNHWKKHKNECKKILNDL
jgi:hypothetical protein